jgi:hypothetical protein
MEFWQIAPEKSASVYECIHFTWPYNAHTVDVPAAMTLKS